MDSKDYAIGFLEMPDNALRLCCFIFSSYGAALEKAREYSEAFPERKYFLCSLEYAQLVFEGGEPHGQQLP